MLAAREAGGVVVNHIVVVAYDTQRPLVYLDRDVLILQKHTEFREIEILCVFELARM